MISALTTCLLLADCTSGGCRKALLKMQQKGVFGPKSDPLILTALAGDYRTPL